MTAPAVAVLVSTRVDPVSGRATRSTADAAAVRLAQSLGVTPALYTAGAMSDAVARDYLALGVPELVRLTGGHPAAALAGAVATTGLVLAGARAQSGHGSGLLPYLVAHLLQRPLVPDVVHLEPDDTGWRVRQALPRGARRVLRVEVPAVLVLSDKVPPARRHAYDAAQRGRIQTRPAAPVALPAWPAEPPWAPEPGRRQLRPLAARVALSGHARMAGAIGGAVTSRAGRVLQSGDADDQALALLDHLRRLSVIPF